MAEQTPEGNTKKGGKKWFGSVVDFFTTEEQAQAPQPSAQSTNAEVAAPSQQPPATQTRTASTIIQGKAGVSNPSIREQLLAAIAAKNVEGLDFFEFNKALDKDKTLREEEKYKKVYTFMVDMSQDGHNLRSVLLDTGKFYLNVLNEEKAGMEEEFKDLEEQRVGSKRLEIERNAHDIEELERQKKDIEQQLQERRVKVAELQDQVDSDSIALQRQRSDFNATFDELFAEYETKLKNIEQYIPQERTNETANQ
jgi:hypothetical protein